MTALRAYGFLLLSLALLVGACSGRDKEGEALLKARQAYSEGQFSEAEGIYEAYLQSNPQGSERWEAWNRLLDISLSVRVDYEKASRLLDAMYLEFGDDRARAGELVVKLADVYETLRMWDKAVESWQKALTLHQQSPARLAESHWRLAKIHQRRREYDLATEALYSCWYVAQDTATKAHCKYELAQTFGYMKKWDDAKKLLEEIRAMPDVDPERHALATFMLADILESEQDYAGAQDLLAAIHATYPNPMVIDARLEHLAKLQKKKK